MLKRMEINGLFGHFNYKIDFKEEGITILTGPNGYGKTTLLRLIQAVAACDYRFLLELNFSDLRISLEDEFLIDIKKQENTLEITDSGHPKPFIVNSVNSEILGWTLTCPDGTVLSAFGVIAQAQSGVNQHFSDDAEERNRSRQTGQFPYSGKFSSVYLIREQRLLRNIPRPPPPLCQQLETRVPPLWNRIKTSSRLLASMQTT